MSIHELWFFPRHFHGRRPDWAALERRLLDEAILLPPTGINIPRQDIYDLVHRLSPTGFLPLQEAGRVGSVAELIEVYKAEGALPASVAVTPAMRTAEIIAMFEAHGVTMDERWLSEGVRHRLGPGARELFADAQGWDANHEQFAITLCEYHDMPTVSAGENLEPPLSPSTGEPLEELAPFGSHIDFIGAVYENPDTTWTDPLTGLPHRILDLDWRHTFGMGYCAVKLEYGLGPGDDVFYERFAERLSRYAGEPMVMACLHL